MVALVSDRHIGVVAKASALRAADPGFDSCVCRGLFVGWLVGWLLNVPATCECILGTDLEQTILHAATRR